MEAQYTHTSHNVLQTQFLVQRQEPIEPGDNHWPGRLPKETGLHATYQAGHLSMVTDRRPFLSNDSMRNNPPSSSICQFYYE